MYFRFFQNLDVGGSKSIYTCHESWRKNVCCSGRRLDSSLTADRCRICMDLFGIFVHLRVYIYFVYEMNMIDKC